MGVRKTDEQQIRKLTKNGSGTYSVSVPIELVRELRWQVGQQVVVKRHGKRIVIEDWSA